MSRTVFKVFVNFEDMTVGIYDQMYFLSLPVVAAASVILFASLQHTSDGSDWASMAQSALGTVHTADCLNKDTQASPKAQR